MIKTRTIRVNTEAEVARQNRYRERQKAAGLVRVQVVVPAGTETIIQEAAARLRGGPIEHDIR